MKTSRFAQTIEGWRTRIKWIALSAASFLVVAISIFVLRGRDLFWKSEQRDSQGPSVARSADSPSSERNQGALSGEAGSQPAVLALRPEEKSAILRARQATELQFREIELARAERVHLSVGEKFTQISYVIKEPGEEILARMTEIAGQQIESLPQALRKTAREEFQNLYFQYARYTGPYRYVYAQADAQGTPTIAFGFTDDPKKAIPQADGSFKAPGKVQILQMKPGSPIAERFSHLINFEQPNQ